MFSFSNGVEKKYDTAKMKEQEIPHEKKIRTVFSVMKINPRDDESYSAYGWDVTP